MLPISSFFTERVLHYKTVHGHFRKWSRNGEWEKVWGIVLHRYRSFLDMSCVELDGSHTTALRGGSAVAIKDARKGRRPMPYMSLTAREYRLPCPLPLRVRTTMFTTSLRYFLNCSRGLIPRPWLYRDSSLTQMRVLTLNSSDGDAIKRGFSKRRFQQTPRKAKGGRILKRIAVQAEVLHWKNQYVNGFIQKRTE